MPAIIGGSPSTGSSVIVNVLNRHSKLYAGPETHLFTKPNLYYNWNRYKKSILRPGLKGMRSPGIHRYNGVILDQRKPLRKLILQSDSFQKFADSYFLDSGKSDWIEKTPANTYCFNLCLSHFDNIKVILMIRNPYDAVASMNARGISVARASALFMANSLANFHLRNHENYFTLKYESLVSTPKLEVSKLCTFLNLEFENDMLQGDDELEKMHGWKQNEKASIGRESLNRFDELIDDKKEEIINALASVKLISEKWPFVEVGIRTIKDICAHFDYEYYDGKNQKKIQSLFVDKMISTLRLYPTNILNYPVTFS